MVVTMATMSINLNDITTTLTLTLVPTTVCIIVMLLSHTRGVTIAIILVAMLFWSIMLVIGKIIMANITFTSLRIEELMTRGCGTVISRQDDVTIGSMMRSIGDVIMNVSKSLEGVTLNDIIPIIMKGIGSSMMNGNGKDETVTGNGCAGTSSSIADVMMALVNATSDRSVDYINIFDP